MPRVSQNRPPKREPQPRPMQLPSSRKLCIGRPRVNRERDREIVRRHESGETLEALGREFGCTKQAMFYAVRRERQRAEIDRKNGTLSIAQGRLETALYVLYWGFRETDIAGIQFPGE